MQTVPSRAHPAFSERHSFRTCSNSQLTLMYRCSAVQRVQRSFANQCSVPRRTSELCRVGFSRSTRPQTRCTPHHWLLALGVPSLCALVLPSVWRRNRLSQGGYRLSKACLSTRRAQAAAICRSNCHCSACFAAIFVDTSRQRLAHAPDYKYKHTLCKAAGDVVRHKTKHRYSVHR